MAFSRLGTGKFQYTPTRGHHVPSPRPGYPNPSRLIFLCAHSLWHFLKSSSALLSHKSQKSVSIAHAVRITRQRALYPTPSTWYPTYQDAIHIRSLNSTKRTARKGRCVNEDFLSRWCVHDRSYFLKSPSRCAALSLIGPLRVLKEHIRR